MDWVNFLAHLDPDEAPNLLPGIYLARVTKAQATELHFIIDDFSRNYEFGPAPYPRPREFTDIDGTHPHDELTIPAHDPHDHPGVELPVHNHGGTTTNVTAGTPDVQAVSAGGHSGSAKQTGSAHRHRIRTPNLPPVDTEIVVAFIGGDPDKPRVLTIYGWPE